MNIERSKCLQLEVIFMLELMKTERFWDIDEIERKNIDDVKYLCYKLITIICVRLFQHQLFHIQGLRFMA